MAQNVVTKKNELTAITSDNQLSVVKEWGEAFNNLIKTQNVTLTPVEKEFGISIITNLTDRCIKDGINANDLNMTNFLDQVRHCSKLQLSINEQELYLDIRNNKETGLKDVKIARQYQGTQKLMTRYCTKKIIRFMDGIVCKGDEFETEIDFGTGIEKILKHKKNPNVDRNKLENVEKAYAIAYVEELGTIVPYTVVVPLQRIIRAKNAAKTDKVWLSDTNRMITKTAYWCLWAFMKPYIELPIGIQESIVATNDEMDWDAETNSENVYDIEEPTQNNGTRKEKEKTIDEIVVEGEQIATQEEDEIKIIFYGEYKDHEDLYVPVNYPDGRKAYQESNGKKTIRVKIKK